MNSITQHSNNNKNVDKKNYQNKSARANKSKQMLINATKINLFFCFFLFFFFGFAVIMRLFLQCIWTKSTRVITTELKEHRNRGKNARIRTKMTAKKRSRKINVFQIENIDLGKSQWSKGALSSILVLIKKEISNWKQMPFLLLFCF